MDEQYLMGGCFDGEAGEEIGSWTEAYVGDGAPEFARLIDD
jgi:hypothetical protein